MRPPVFCCCGAPALFGFACCTTCVARDVRGKPIELRDARDRDVEFDPDADEIANADGERAHQLQTFARAGGAA
jgi:hypothetical protein